jgi:uncharacterized membrane protein (DUF373 family)
MGSKDAKVAGLLEAAESYIYYGAALVLVMAASGLILFAVVETIRLAFEGDFTRGVINLLDRVLLALMVAEIIYTVTNMAKHRRLDVNPFLVIGIIAAVRRLLVITAESASHIDMTDPTFQAALAELGLLAVIIILLAASFRLLPSSLHPVARISATRSEQDPLP